MDINNYNVWKILIRISLRYNKKTPMYLKPFADLIDIENTHPNFYYIMKLLEEKGILKYHRSISSAKFIEIDIKKLDDMIENSNIFKEFYNYLDSKRFIHIDLK